NPGIRTATTGHAYSHPSNLFWKLAYSSGCTPRLCKPEEDQDLPHLYALGHTNIVSRPTKDAGELSKSEMDEGVAILEQKIRKWRPESVAIVGKSIWESIWRVRHGKNCGKGDFKYGWQDDSERMGVVETEDEERWHGAKVFVATTTSGLAAGMRPHEKEEVWRGLGQWVKQRR
ncbi:uracil-DNA glycosylase-like protein, partial [Usnea florida]